MCLTDTDCAIRASNKNKLCADDILRCQATDLLYLESLYINIRSHGSQSSQRRLCALSLFLRGKGKSERILILHFVLRLRGVSDSKYVWKRNKVNYCGIFDFPSKWDRNYVLLGKVFFSFIRTAYFWKELSKVHLEKKEKEEVVWDCRLCVWVLSVVFHYFRPQDS